MAIRLVDDHQYVAQVHGPPDLIRVVAQNDGYARDAGLAHGANDRFDKRVPAVSEQGLVRAHAGGLAGS